MRRRLVAWVVVLMLLGAGAALAHSRVIRNSDTGRFRGDMPSSPTITAVPVPVGSSQTVPMTEAEVRLHDAIYRASSVDYSERIARAVSIDLPWGARKLTLGRFSGREYLNVQPNGIDTAAPSWWVRGWLYQLTVASDAGIEGQPDTRRSFDSYNLATQ